MNDLISRQAALQAMDTWDKFGCGPDGRLVRCNDDSHYVSYVHYDDMVHAIEHLSPAEPEHPSEIQDILNYLDTVLHPIISPEHWDVYSELHDMISMLPSAKPERNSGKWIEVDDAYNRISGRCSACGWEAHMYEDDVVGMPFCPNCGASMKTEV